MSEENKFKLTPSKKIDNDKLGMDEHDFITKGEDSPEIPEKEIQDNIEKFKSDDLKIQIESISFFERILRYHDIILPCDYLEATLDFFQSQTDNKELVNLLLALYRHCTGFESEMQDFLFEKEIINVIVPFFPDEKVLAILGNLSTKSIEMSSQLLSLDVLEQITPLISAFTEAESSEISDKDSEIVKNYINAVDLLDCLLYNFDESLSEFIPKIVELFDIICSSYEKVPEEQAKNIVQAFDDYVKKDSVFIQSFCEKRQLKVFLENEKNDNEVLCLIIQIVKSIINEYDCKGVDYLIEFDIISWIEKQIFSDSQQVVYKCFAALTQMIDRYDPRDILSAKNPESESSIQIDEKSKRPLNLANECIENELLIKAIDKFYGENIYRLKFTLYEFVCTVFMNATYDQIPLLINEKALDLIVCNYEIIDDDEDEWFLVWESLHRLVPFKYIFMDTIGEVSRGDIDAVQEKIKKIKEDVLFIKWLLDCRDSEDFFDCNEHDEVLKILVDLKEDEEEKEEDNGT